MGIELNDKLRTLMNPEDRKDLGKAGKTYEEAEAGAEVRLEKELHEQYLAYLRRNGFNMNQVIHAPMSKRSQLPEGFPDFLVLRDGKALAIEFKTPGKKASEQQEKVINGLINDGFKAYVLSHYSSAILVTTETFGL